MADKYSKCLPELQWVPKCEKKKLRPQGSNVHYSEMVSLQLGVYGGDAVYNSVLVFVKFTVSEKIFHPQTTLGHAEIEHIG
jgi:hypothetical protein